MKHVLVTGASSGIGRAISQKFHQTDHFIYLLARNHERLDQLHRDLPNSTIVTCDLSDPKQIERLPSKIDFNKIDILINNAGVYFNKPNEEFTNDEWCSLFQINFLATAHLSALIFPCFKRKRNGCITMISSTLASRPVANTAAYSASKAAIQSLTQTLALEGAPYGIRVNCVAPGIVETPIHKLNLLDPESRKNTESKMHAMQPLARMGRGQDIAEAVWFLSSDLSAWTTGTVLNVDGGINIK